MKNLLMPRITAAQARVRLVDLEAFYTLESAPLPPVFVDFPGAVPNPVGGQAASPSNVRMWRESVLLRMQSASTVSVIESNRHSLLLGQAIAEIIDPVVADAGHDGVWSFLSLYVFPDLVFQRWPGNVEDGRRQLPVDRWVGAQISRDRNYVKSAWRRWRIFGDLLLEANPPLGEDEYGALLERSAVARNHRLVVRSAEAIISHGSGQRGAGRSAFAREFMKLVALQTGPKALEVLSNGEMDELMDRLADEARDTLTTSS